MRFLRLYCSLLLCVLLLHAFAGGLINHWGMTGQSLSNGFNGDPALSTTQPYSNLTLNESFGFPQGPNLVALIESGVETPQSGMGNELTALSSGQSYIAAITRCGQNASLYDEIKVGTTSFNRCVTEWTTAQTAASMGGYTYRVAGMSVIHGETDFSSDTSMTTYLNDMVAFQADFKASCISATGGTCEMPMLLNQMSSWKGAANRNTPTTSGGADSIPTSVWRAARANPTNLFLVGPNYYLAYGSDGLHLANTGYRILGEQFGKVADSVINTGAWLPLSPKPTITNIGAIVTVQLNVPVSPIVIDTTTLAALGSKGNAHGFEWFDDSGTPVTVTLATCATTTCTITLSGAPTGTLSSRRLLYAWTGSGLAGASGAAHGDIRDSDPKTGITSGAHLYNWLITFSEPVTEISPSSSLSGRASVSGRASMN